MADGQPGDVSITALYTAQTWAWGGLACAPLFSTSAGRVVFACVNLALAIARLFNWKLRSLRHSLLHRHVMIDHLVKTSGAMAVLELASGLSRRGATLSQDPAMSVTEVDLPAMIEAKRRLLERSEAGRSVLTRSNLSWVARDLRTQEMLDLVQPGQSVAIVAEGLLMYLQPAEQRAFWARVHDALGHAGRGVFIFDLVPTCEQPAPGLVGKLLEWTMKRFTKGQGFTTDERTRAEIVGELAACGFEQVEALEPQHVAQKFSLPYPSKKTQQLVFACQLKPHQSPNKA